MEHTIIYFIAQVIMASIGTFAFSVLFSTRPRYYFWCGITGGIGWAVYLVFTWFFDRPIFGTFVAALFITMMSFQLSVKLKAPTTIFLLCGIFALVPGGGIYHTAYAFFVNATDTAMVYLFDSVKTAVAIGLGIGVAYSITPTIFGWKTRPEVWVRK